MSYWNCRPVPSQQLPHVLCGACPVRVSILLIHRVLGFLPSPGFVRGSSQSFPLKVASPVLSPRPDRPASVSPPVSPPSPVRPVATPPVLPPRLVRPPLWLRPVFHWYFQKQDNTFKKHVSTETSVIFILNQYKVQN